MKKGPAGLASHEAHKKINHFNGNRPKGICQMKKYELTENAAGDKPLGSNLTLYKADLRPPR